MTSISANDLKVKASPRSRRPWRGSPRHWSRVRGKDRFVVMDLPHYQYLRECELEAALAQARADLAAGRCVAESADAHLDRIEAALDAEPTRAPSGRG